MARTTRYMIAGIGVVLLLAAAGAYLYGAQAGWWPSALGIAGVLALAAALFVGVDWRRVRQSRALYYGSSSTILTVAVVAIVVLLNAIASNHHIRFDLTPEGLYSLSDQTVKVLGDLDRDINVYAFVQQGNPEGQRVVDFIREYTYRNDRVKLEVVDPNRQPSVAQEYGVRAYNTVVVEAGDERRTVQAFDLFRVDQFSGALEFSGEQALTRALIGVASEGQGVVYFTIGHGEQEPSGEYSQVSGFLTGEGYGVEALNIAERGGVPDDAAVVVIAGPQRDLTAAEADAIRAYLNGGGRALALIDPTLPTVRLDNVMQLLAEWGVTPRVDIVVDPERHYFVDVLSPIPSYREHEVTRELMERNLGLVLPRTRSLMVERLPSGGPRVFSTTLLETSQQSWGETTLPLTPQVSADGPDVVGPLTVAVALERRGTDVEESRMIVVGTSSFAGNQAINFQGNIDFVVNAVNWLSGREELISIRPKVQQFEPVQLTGRLASVIFYSTVLVVPVLFLLGAGAVAWRRRSL